MKRALSPTLLAACLAFGCGDDGPSSPDDDQDVVADVVEDGADVTADFVNDLDAGADVTTSPDADASADLGEDPDPDAEPDTEDTGGDVSVDAPADSRADVGSDADVPDVPIEVRELEVLVVGHRLYDVANIAATIDAVLDAHPALEVTRADALDYIEPGLLGFAYGWTGREGRLAPLDDGYDLVIVIDAYDLADQSPEAHFEGVRVLQEIVEPDGQIAIAANGQNEAVVNSYRVGAGLGVPVLPITRILQVAAATSGNWDAALSGALIYALTGDDPTPYRDAETSVLTWENVSEAVVLVMDSDARTPQFDEPWSGAVRIDPVPTPETYYFMLTGTSSERGWEVAMSALLEREGIDYVSVNLGQCNDFRSMDEGCLERAEPYFEENEFMSLYARAYDVSADAIFEAGGFGLQPQVYERHWDMPDNPGTIALDQIDDRVRLLSRAARDLDLAWLPYHINFARLKYTIPEAQLLTDGVHATSAVQSGMAAMSFYSRTGIEPSTDEVDEETATAMALGISTIQQLSTLSSSGEPVVDDPESRPRLR